jgi:uncharacterized protein YbaR (Trm112 family)
MKHCFNHLDKKAYSVCHNCGKDFCEECLDEGKEYYYCKNPECLKTLKAETVISPLPEVVVCPNCESELELSESERESRQVHCPECESFIDFNQNPPKIVDDKNFVEICSSLNMGDVALIKSILDDAGIEYYAYGENFMAVRPLLEPIRFFVNEGQLEEAKELLKDFKLHVWGFSKNQND